MKEPPEYCSVCGAKVPRKSLSCPECGADERTGWNEDESIYDGLDLPSDLDEMPESGRSSHWLRNAIVGTIAVLLIVAYVVLRVG